MAANGLVLLVADRPPKRRPDYVRGTPRKGVAPLGSSGSRSQDKRSQKQIALVEDEMDLLTTYEVVLKKLGWTPVLSTSKGEAIVEAVKRREIEPDVVIMDYRLPGIDGIDAGKRILRRLPGTKVILTTADESMKSAAEEAGMYFLRKPFSIKNLVQFLDTL